MRGGADPRTRLLAIFDALEEWFERPDFHGCMFINAAAEFPSLSSAIHREAARHKDLVWQFVLDLARDGLPWAVGAEFQLQPDPDMGSRMMIYLGEARLSLRPSDNPGDRFNVGGIVVNLTKQGACGRDMHWQNAGLR